MPLNPNPSGEVMDYCSTHNELFQPFRVHASCKCGPFPRGDSKRLETLNGRILDIIVQCRSARRGRPNCAIRPPIALVAMRITGRALCQNACFDGQTTYKLLQNIYRR